MKFSGQMVDIWAPVLRKNTVYFADKNALKGTLLETLKEVRPTFLFGVPRVWEKIMEGMLAKGKSVKGLKRKIGKTPNLNEFISSSFHTLGCRS